MCSDIDINVYGFKRSVENDRKDMGLVESGNKGYGSFVSSSNRVHHFAYTTQTELRNITIESDSIGLSAK